MSATKTRSGVFLILLLSSCQGAHQTELSEDSAASFSRSVSYLDPNRAENQLFNESAYGQIILTVDSDEVIQEINGIEEIRDAIQEITFVRSNNSFQSIVYVVKFKRNVNPIPYYNFVQSYEGVLAAEFDGIVGLAGFVDNPEN